MNLDPAITLAKHFEQLHKVVRRVPYIAVKPYICPAGYWTIGYGHLCRPEHPIIREDEAEQFLAKDIQIAVSGVIRYCPNLVKYPLVFNAIVDFTFNLGVGRLQTSTLRRRLLQENWSEVQYELRRWVYGGGKKLSGLIKRREAEVALILKEVG